MLADKYKEIGTIRGVGPMLALEFVKNSDPRQPDADLAQRVIDACRDNGLLVIKCGVHRNNVRLLAPITTEFDDAREALDMLDRAIAKSTR
ncbi:aminotransferase class III-fold pyridoxal phosphate-dependent enzyme [Cupriavidus basilensis]